MGQTVRYWQVCITDLVELHFVSTGFVTVGVRRLRLVWGE